MQGKGSIKGSPYEFGKTGLLKYEGWLQIFVLELYQMSKNPPR